MESQFSRTRSVGVFRKEYLRRSISSGVL